MECAVITTYRCNARCQMCNTWQYPSKRSEEFSPEILEKLPAVLPTSQSPQVAFMLPQAATLEPS